MSYHLNPNPKALNLTLLDIKAILQESEAQLEMKIFNPSSFFVWR